MGQVSAKVPERLEVGIGPLAMREVRTPGHFRTLAMISLALAFVGAMFLFIPWQQTAMATGRVIALDPNDRQQVIDAPIEGRVALVHVLEGSRVEEGDVLIELTDNDPRIVERLGAEQQALTQRVASARSSVFELEGRVLDLQESRIRALAAAEARVSVARDRAVAAENRIAEIRAQLLRDEAQLERRTAGLAAGVASARDLEIAAADAERSRSQLAQAEAAARAANNELRAAREDRARLDADATANIAAARSARDNAELSEQAAVAELARMEVRSSRQEQMYVRAPRNGRVLRVLANPGSELLRPGDPLLLFVPDTDVRAVELWVDGRDAPFVHEGSIVRLQFEGWPALQFGGAPGIAAGTFGGRVLLMDASTEDESGRFRLLVTPDPEEPPWPDVDVLRQGNRAASWIALGTVPLAFEIWRQVNGFPPGAPPMKKESSPDIGVSRGSK